jgi:hypothetical protein
MKNSTAKTLGVVLGALFVVLIFGGLFAWFTNWILSMIIDWPVTLSNWGITWGCITVLNFIFGNSSKKA